MKADEAIATVIDLEVVRARVRHDLAPQDSVRVPLLVFGALTLGSAVVAAAAPGIWLGAYWLLAAPLGIAVVGRHYRGLRDRAGAGPQGTTPMCVSAGIGVAAFLAGWFGGPVAAGLAIGAGYGVMAAVVRSATMAWLGAGVTAAALLLAVAGSHHADVVLPAALGSALLVAGWRS